ncbi:MAG: DMT family transporter [Gallionellaceae bacterium]
MNWKERFRQPGIPAALGAALLFGAGTPLAKWLLDAVDAWLLAGLLYLGSGVGLTLYRRLSHAPAVRLPRNDLPWFAGAILAGGIVGPVLLMIGLTGLPASGASLLLNAEGVFTALLAWFVFKENFDRRIALGMLAIVTGAVVLSWPGDARFAGLWPTLAVLGACLAWGIDNNLTRKVSLTDATWIASVKGLVSGAVNLILAISLGASMPALPTLAGAMVACLPTG